VSGSSTDMLLYAVTITFLLMTYKKVMDHVAVSDEKMYRRKARYHVRRISEIYRIDAIPDTHLI